ncbi:MAG: peptidoglycan recognition family protein [Anaerolineae bacterium]|nr:peptidoglycan recognition family protein [Anaerolineae bacterium]
MRPINKLFIHITDSYSGDGPEITGWHTWPKKLVNGRWRHKKVEYDFDDLPPEVRGKQGNDWDHVGYHYLIGSPYRTATDWRLKKPDPSHDGKIYELLPHGTAGYHASGHNADSLSIVLVAKADHDTRRGVVTGSQLTKLRRLTKSLIARYPGLEVLGHYETGDPKKAFCPCIDMTWFREYLHTNQS